MLIGSRKDKKTANARQVLRRDSRRNGCDVGKLIDRALEVAREYARKVDLVYQMAARHQALRTRTSPVQLPDQSLRPGSSASDDPSDKDYRPYTGLRRKSTTLE